jgi:hypothetical protein
MARQSAPGPDALPTLTAALRWPFTGQPYASLVERLLTLEKEYFGDDERQLQEKCPTCAS